MLAAGALHHPDAAVNCRLSTDAMFAQSAEQKRECRIGEPEAELRDCAPSTAIPRGAGD